MKAIASLAAFALALDSGPAEAVDMPRIVASESTLAMVEAVVDRLGFAPEDTPPPIVSAGPDGVIADFCRDAGTAAILVVARQMTAGDHQRCVSRGIGPLVQIMLGYEALVIAVSSSSPIGDLSRKQIFLAFADEVPIGDRLVANPYLKWSDIDPNLPEARIEGLGPPLGSDRLQTFADLALRAGVDALGQSLDEPRLIEGGAALSLRDDGAWLDAGSIELAVIHTLQQSPATIAILDFGALQRHQDVIKGVHIEGVEPTAATIAAGDYPLARPIYVYVRKAEADTMASVKGFVTEIVSDRAAGEGGYLAATGLVALPSSERAAQREQALNLAPWSGP